MAQPRERTSRLRLWLLSGALALAACISGCKGCDCRRQPQRPQTAEELEKELLERQRKLREQEKKADLWIYRYASIPHEPFGSLPKAETQFACFAKPGHWTPLTVTAKANNFDIVGNLELSAVGADENPVPLPGMEFQVATERPAALPKGQAKTFDAVLFLPEFRQRADAAVAIDARRRTGKVFRDRCPVVAMPFFQYHFVVLARFPESYNYLKSLDSVRDPRNLATIDPRQTDSYYRVSLLATGRRTPLPSCGLLWTSIAYLLWDDADPEALNLDQRVALLDWIHWGGQLIVSGPETLDTLGASFLADYLPATSGGNRDLAEPDLAEINRHWTLPFRGREGRRLAPTTKWSAVRLKLHPEAEYVATTGGLLAERRIGRGRIVLSAFKLSGRELVAWPGFDGFFNGCLLRRPARRFEGAPDEFFVNWAGARSAAVGRAAHGQFDTERLCGLRYFSRDAGRRAVDYVWPDRMAAEDLVGPGPTLEVAPGPDPGFVESFEPVPVPGKNVAAWNDFGAVADAARQSLSQATGIEVPERSFVVWIVAGYLIVLVPVNWLVFRILGRVEWAWAAAPAIAMVCAAVVIRQAQLDIGFVRSQNEIAVVEMQADYPRAHVARYTALYTSLSTAYEIAFADLGAQILPFPPKDRPEETNLSLGESPRRVAYRYGSGAAMGDFLVETSRTRVTHCEQMLDMGGGWQWIDTPPGRQRLVNRTGYSFSGVGVVRRLQDGQIETAWLGSVGPEETVELADRWRTNEENQGDSLWPDRRDRTPETASIIQPGSLNLRSLLPLAENTASLRPGDVRLIGWTAEPIAGMEVRPRAPQQRRLALVLVHLRSGRAGDPQPDENTRWDFSSEIPRTLRATPDEPDAERETQDLSPGGAGSGTPPRPAEPDSSPT